MNIKIHLEDYDLSLVSILSKNKVRREKKTLSCYRRYRGIYCVFRSFNLPPPKLTCIYQHFVAISFFKFFSLAP